MFCSFLTKVGQSAVLYSSHTMIRTIIIPCSMHIVRRGQMMSLRRKPSILHTSAKRFSCEDFRDNWRKPPSPARKFNIIQQKGHGTSDYWHGWEALYFSCSDWKESTFFLWSPCFVVVLVALHSIYNAVHNDPEIRLRPQKKAWHATSGKIERAEDYRGGGFWWYPLRHCNDRRKWYQHLEHDGFAEKEPGQIGWEENPVPELA
mmetsp:Transcript_19279/g.30616  ORF Transcript_19279/g.30616 Transcript_19279/m.30616 type:complete len:204 (-) Transcript_19279:56-667(-)